MSTIIFEKQLISLVPHQVLENLINDLLPITGRLELEPVTFVLYQREKNKVLLFNI